MSKPDITDNMSQWEYALYNMRQQRKDRVDALIKKYGFPIEEKNLLKEDYFEYDLLKPELEAMKAEKLAQKPTPHGSSLDDEDMAKNATQTNETAKIQQAKTTLADLGYYRGKIDNLATPGLTKAMNDFAEDHQINERAISESLNKITEKLKSIKTPARLDFDGKYLRFIQDGKLVLVLNAMSGHPDYQNRKYQTVRDKGPLPEGSYRVK